MKTIHLVVGIKFEKDYSHPTSNMNEVIEDAKIKVRHYQDAYPEEKVVARIKDDLYPNQTTIVKKHESELFKAEGWALFSIHTYNIPPAKERIF